MPLRPRQNPTARIRSHQSGMTCPDCLVLGLRANGCDNVRIGAFTASYLPALHGVEVSIETFRRGLQTGGREAALAWSAICSHARRVPVSPQPFSRRKCIVMQ